MLIRALAASLLLLLVTYTYATAQEPAPQPTPEWPRCVDGFPGQDGGRTIAVNFNIGTQVTLPAGTFQELPMPPDSPNFALCHIETGAVVTISGTTCQEFSRRAPTSAAKSVVDQVVSSCRVPAERPPQPHCHDGFYTRGGRGVTIPNADITITLPPGEFINVYGVRGPNTALICKVQDNLVSLDYSVILGSDCSKVEAAWLEEESATVIDQIVASCTSMPGAATLVPPVTGTIRPPDTGNAGLAQSDN